MTGILKILPMTAICALASAGVQAAPVNSTDLSPRVSVASTDTASPPNAGSRSATHTISASQSNGTNLPPSGPIDGEADLIQTPVEKPVLAAQGAPNDAQVQSIAGQTDMKPSDPPSKAGKMLKPDAWGQVLLKYTKTGEDGLVRFDYGGLQASAHDMNMLNAYLDDMAAKTPSTFSTEQAMVYWANLYNALTVKVVADNYPVSSIRKIKSGWRAGPWRRKLITVEGEELTLDNIEHDIMRPTFNTPLVHYMVNCASVGCPNLKRTPWQVSSLEADLRSAAQDFINSPRGVQIDKGRLKVSSIYHWFSEDFGSSHPAVIAHLSEYADVDLAPKLIGRKKIDKFSYDWDLNAP